MLAVAIVQHLLQMVSGLLTSANAWLLTRRHGVVLATYAMSVLCVTRPWFANVILTETLFLLMMNATFFALLLWWDRPSAVMAAFFGAMLGMAILTRPIPKLLWLPLLALFFLQATDRSDVRRILRHVVAAVVAMFAVLAPWSIRNFYVFQNASVAAVPPINKWVVCFHDHSAADLPIPQTAAGDRLRTLLPDIDDNSGLRRDGYEVIRRLERAGLSFAEIDDLLTPVCMDAIKANPGTFSWKTFKRFVNFWRCAVKDYPFYSSYAADRPIDYDGQKHWRFEPVASWFETFLRRPPSNTLTWIEIDSLACGLGTLLLIRRRHTRTIGLALAVIFLYFTGVTAILEIENYRYRLVLDPLIIVATTCGLSGHLGQSGSTRPMVS